MVILLAAFFWFGIENLDWVHVGEGERFIVVEAKYQSKGFSQEIKGLELKARKYLSQIDEGTVEKIVKEIREIERK
ncbi:hypothetical protein [Urinicoccus timonensis]|uniref:hypothetical protein n=1 Tax=Urinicoccus timonensis TaxID=2024205 RepID=UPI000C06CDC9|nr:hypothetical protein [Urinicoccus timonensis]